MALYVGLPAEYTQLLRAAAAPIQTAPITSLSATCTKVRSNMHPVRRVTFAYLTFHCGLARRGQMAIGGVRDLRTGQDRTGGERFERA